MQNVFYMELRGYKMKIAMWRIIEEYNNLSNGGHWFDTDTMKFFKCRLPDYGYRKENNVYFISRV